MTLFFGHIKLLLRGVWVSCMLMLGTTIVFAAEGNDFLLDRYKAERKNGALDSLPEVYLSELLNWMHPKDHRHGVSRRVTLQDSTWRDWQKRTGELPPDFKNMSFSFFLQDPLVWNPMQGKTDSVKNQADWRKRREDIKSAYQHWVSGSFPPKPTEFRTRILAQSQQGAVLVKRVECSFGPSFKAKITLECFIPMTEAKKRLPVYLTQWNHRSWAQLAVRRGYIGIIYSGADEWDDTEAYQALYPTFDFTALMRRAWGASRVVDYIETMPEADPSRIVITGHSRNGKQSLWAAAMDERFAAVISSSCGTGGVTPWRFSDPSFANQTMDDIMSNASHWFHPRLRFFYGREQYLPVDQNLLLSLIAPRLLILHSSMVERQLNPWATEQCFQSVRSVYQWMDKPQHIQLVHRMGEHAVASRDLEQVLDVVDAYFAGQAPTSAKGLLYPFASPHSSTLFPKNSSSLSGAPVKRENKTTAQKWRDWLGQSPAIVPAETIAPTTPTRIDWVQEIIGRPKPSGAVEVSFGPYKSPGTHLSGTLYLPAAAVQGKTTGAIQQFDEIKLKDSSKRLPLVLYLHEFSFAHGYAAGYSFQGGNGNKLLFEQFLSQGIAVLAFEQIGFGGRIEEVSAFYKRFPNWSILGNMVADTKSWIPCLENLPWINSNKIWLVGNSLGGTVSLLTGMFEPKVAGVLCINGYSSWKKEPQASPWLTGLTVHMGLLPLAPQRSTEVDLEDAVHQLIEQRKKVLLISGTHDRWHPVSNVRASVKKIQHKMPGSQNLLRFQEVNDINRINEKWRSELASICSWIHQGNLNE